MSESEPKPRSEVASPDSVRRFGEDLQHLRVTAGTSKYAALQTATGISRTVLWEAFSGNQLPSARTVEAIVRTCGGDVDVWLKRRATLAAKEAVSSSPPAAEPTTTPRMVRRRTAILFAIGAFVIGASLSAACVTVLTSTGSGSSLSAEVVTGDDPAATVCLKDADVVASETRADGVLVEILFSDVCQAGWGRITRSDGLSAGNTITVTTYPDPASDADDRQEATAQNVQSVYTHLVVRPTPQTLICITGTVTAGDNATDIGPPLCT